MSETTDPVLLDDIQTFVKLVELGDIRVMGISGALEDEPADEEPDEYELTFSPGFKSDGLATRFKIEFNNGRAVFMADLVAHWVFPRPVVFDAATVIEFSERVAFMTVYPYLRESIGTTAARMNQPVPTLGLIKADNFSLNADEESLQRVIDRAASLAQ